MKTSFFVVSCFVLTSFSSTAFAQPGNYWVGGAPGHENEWNCPKNWSEGSVPNEFSNVIIPDVSTGSRANPVLRSGMMEIGSLVLESNASLEIGKQATLVIYDGLFAVNRSDLNSKGTMIQLTAENSPLNKEILAQVVAGN